MDASDIVTSGGVLRGQVGRVWFKSPTGLKTRLQQSLAYGRPLWTRPWIGPSAWTTGQAVQSGEVRKNSATPAQWYIAGTSGTCGATEPTHVDGSLTSDGGVSWSHLGGPDWDTADMPGKPTIGLALGGSTPAGMVAFDVWANRNLLTLNGAYGVQYFTANMTLFTFNAKAANPVQRANSVQFWSDAPKIGFKVESTNSGMRLYCDGHPVTMSPIYPYSGTTQFFTVDWGVRKTRLWEIVFTKESRLLNMAVASSDQVWPYKPPASLRGIFIGDSYLEGSGNGPFLHGNTLSGHFGRLIGIDDMWRAGMGGTGLLNPGSGPFYTYRQRLPELLGFSPDVIFVQGSTNDASYTQSQVNTEALAFLDAIRAATTAPVFWFGPAPLSGNYSGIQTVDTAIASAVSARPSSNIFYKSIVTDAPPWFTGAHNNTNYGWSSNISQYIGGDNTHPVDKGTMYLALRMASAYTNEMLPLVT